MLRRRALRGGRARGGALVLLACVAMMSAPALAAGRTREYWIAAVPTTWNIVPSGHDPMMGTTYTAAQALLPTVVYRRYSAHWKQPLTNSPVSAVDHNLIPGPLLHARVGDRIVVHFLNKDTLLHNPHSMHFHGVRYRPSSDGSYVPGFSGPDGDVKVGHSQTYVLNAASDSAGVWPYHDHSPSMDQSIAGGMYGVLSILGRHERPPDREFVVVFAALGQFMTIDGRAFLGNTPVFRARVGQRVQWDVMTMGSDFHTFHVHGHRWRDANGVPRDTITVGPAESFAIRWREQDPGTWLYHCHVEEHMDMGMIGIYRVSPR